jgi:hypothetical protein
MRHLIPILRQRNHKDQVEGRMDSCRSPKDAVGLSLLAHTHLNSFLGIFGLKDTVRSMTSFSNSGMESTESPVLQCHQKVPSIASKARAIITTRPLSISDTRSVP